MESCNSNHEQIMAELKRIQDRMDADWELIKASEDDRLRREGIWSVIRWIGFGGAVAIIHELTTSGSLLYLFK